MVPWPTPALAAGAGDAVGAAVAASLAAVATVAAARAMATPTTAKPAAAAPPGERRRAVAFRAGPTRQAARWKDRCPVPGAGRAPAGLAKSSPPRDNAGVPPASPSSPPRAPARENMLVNLACNIVLPGLILSKLGAEDRLGPVLALVVGMAFPLGYGIHDLVSRGRWNFFSVVGLASVGLTGGFALLKVDGFWFAVKEASVPSLFAVAVLATLRSESPLVRTLILNESVIDVPRLEAALAGHGSRARFDELLRQSTWWMAGSFALSAVLNFVLARIVLTSPSGTPEFTAELGRMTWLSWPVIALPGMVLTSVILWRLMHGIHELTGLGLEDLVHGHSGDGPGDRPS